MKSVRGKHVSNTCGNEHKLLGLRNLNICTKWGHMDPHGASQTKQIERSALRVPYKLHI